MHTTTMMTDADFTISIDGRKGLLEDVFPDFNKNDRVGIIVSQDGGSAGASALIMSAITKFYSFHRGNLGGKTHQLWIYPDFFVFHVGRKRMNHYWMDIWPAHKEVLVEDDPEQILEAINDRSITRLVVEEREMVEGIFLRETLTSANRRIISALAYSPTGRVKQGDVEITSCSAAENCVLDSIERTATITDDMRTQLKERRKDLRTGLDGNILESYPLIYPSDALGMLTSNTKPGATTRKYLSALQY